MHFYSLSYGELMSLPIKTFWMLNGNIERIEAQKDMRALTIAVNGNAGAQAAQDYRQRLVIEVGTVVKLEDNPVALAVRDEEGFAELKAMAQRMK